MSGTRRSFLQDAALLGAGLFGWSRQATTATTSTGGKHAKTPARLSATPKPPVPVITPDVPDLPFEMDGTVKVFRLKAEPLKRKIAPFKTIDAWGYNGSCPGPTIQINQGDRVRIIVENALPESTSMHWHGLEVPIEQDGVPYVSQKPIAPGETYTYEFTVNQEGTGYVGTLAVLLPVAAAAHRL
jgi:FtsP/CotA-like multicopper oxidase with cupredoxin domain